MITHALRRLATLSVIAVASLSAQQATPRTETHKSGGATVASRAAAAAATPIGSRAAAPVASRTAAPVGAPGGAPVAARAAAPATAPVASRAVAPATAPVASRAAAPVTARDTATHQDELAYRREVFAYESGGRRDPFVSLATTGVLRPTIADLLLVGIAYATRNGAGGAQSIAIFRDRQTKEQYRVRVGQPLGRMRVASIEPRRVVFSIDEFGVSRQESIAMGDSTRTITPTRAP